MERTCLRCGKAFEADKSQRLFCSRTCYFESRVGTERLDLRIKPIEKTCPVCGKIFLVGGQGRPPKRQVLCSDECQRRSRYRSGHAAKELAPLDASYLAGLIDGEGSVFLWARRGVASLRLAISNTHRGVLEWVAEATGVGRVQNMRTDGQRHRASYSWQTAGDTAENILRQVMPYMRVKREQAALGIAVQVKLRDPARKADRAWQAESVTRMKTLNQRGPRRMLQSTYDLTINTGG